MAYLALHLLPRTALVNLSHAEEVYCVNGIPYSVRPSVRGLVMTTCLLSMLGALLIIVSYALIPDLRTKAREILVNLCVMDFLAAGANFVGVAVNFDHLLYNTSHPRPTVNRLCVAQAFIAMYGTVASVFWTMCIAVYIYLWVMLEGKKIVRQSVYGFYVLCYGLPLVLSVWFVSTGRLGYAPYGGSGWCSVILTTMEYNAIVYHAYLAVLGNDIWIYLTIILVPVIFVALKLYIRSLRKSGTVVLSSNLASMVQSVEMKLLFIPIVFILLRLWSLLLVIITVEAQHRLSCTAISFFLHAAGVGDSAQGIANAVIFGLFTPKVRQFFVYHLTCRYCCKNRPIGSLFINADSPSVSKYTSLESSNRNADLSESSLLSSDKMMAPEADRTSLLA